MVLFVGIFLFWFVNQPIQCGDLKNSTQQIPYIELVGLTHTQWIACVWDGAGVLSLWLCYPLWVSKNPSESIEEEKEMRVHKMLLEFGPHIPKCSCRVGMRETLHPILLYTCVRSIWWSPPHPWGLNGILRRQLKTLIQWEHNDFIIPAPEEETFLRLSYLIYR